MPATDPAEGSPSDNEERPRHGKGKKRRIPWEAVGAIAAIVAIVVSWAAAEGLLSPSSHVPPSIEARALSHTDLQVWIGDRRSVGGELLVLNNLGGPSRAVLWIGASHEPHYVGVFTFTPLASGKVAHRHVSSKRAKSPSGPSSESLAATVLSFPKRSGEAVVSYWSLDTCSSNAVQITQYHPYVLLIDPEIGSTHELPVPVFLSDVRYVVHLNDGTSVTVAPGSLSSDAATSFKTTADEIVKKCAGV